MEVSRPPSSAEPGPWAGGSWNRVKTQVLMCSGVPGRAKLPRVPASCPLGHWVPGCESSWGPARCQPGSAALISGDLVTVAPHAQG